METLCRLSYWGVVEYCEHQRSYTTSVHSSLGAVRTPVMVPGQRLPAMQRLPDQREHGLVAHSGGADGPSEQPGVEPVWSKRA
jgi:hypothetical protein